MRKQVGLVSGYLGAALLVLSSAVSGADDPKRQELSEVVLKSLDTKLLVIWSAASIGDSSRTLIGK